MANKKTTISCQCPINIRDKFQRLYPYTLSRFLLNCIKLAIKDKKFFDNVYFQILDSEVALCYRKDRDEILSNNFSFDKSEVQ